MTLIIITVFVVVQLELPLLLYCAASSAVKTKAFTNSKIHMVLFVYCNLII